MSLKGWGTRMLGVDRQHEGYGPTEAFDSQSYPESKTAGAACQHESSQRIHHIGQGIQVGDNLQPARHDGGRVDRVAGKEQWHGEHLAHAHSARRRLESLVRSERMGPPVPFYCRMPHAKRRRTQWPTFPTAALDSFGEYEAADTGGRLLALAFPLC